MQPDERIISIRIIEKLKDRDAYATQIGVKGSTIRKSKIVSKDKEKKNGKE